MKHEKIVACLLGVFVAGMACGDTVFSGGDAADPLNWSSGVPNSAGDPNGIVNVSGTVGIGNMYSTTFAGATLTIDNGATLAFAEDTHGGTAVGPFTHYVVNNGTITAGDDIFTANGTITFNAGSSGQAFGTTDSGKGDLQAQGTGTLTINGGTHSAARKFGGQSTAVLNFLGGSATCSVLQLSGATTIGGDATATATGTTATSDLRGAVNILSTWSGSLTANNFNAATWESVVTGSWTLDGVAIDAASFADNFEVLDGGKTLAIPEPTTISLIGIMGGVIVFVRRRMMI